MVWLVRTAFLVVVVLVVATAPRWWESLTGGRDLACGVGRIPGLVTVQPPPLRLAMGGPDPREALADRHELVPDRRLLLALSIADCLITRDTPVELSGTFADGSWTLEKRGEVIGVLPELPDFGVGLALLSGHVRQVVEAEGLESAGAVEEAELAEVRERLASATTLDVIGALARIDSLWSDVGTNPALVELAAQALVRLALVADDRLELADPLLARALATLAVARGVGGSELRREEALLALKMGYSAHAEAVASSLPANDPVRLFILQDEEGLARRAAEPDADGLTRHLARGGLASPPGDGPEEARERRLPLVVPPNLRLAIYLADVILSEHGLDGIQSAAEFERSLAERTRPFGGPFLDGDTYAAYLSSAFYGELHAAASRHLSCGCTDHGVFERQLQNAPPGPGAELSRWFEHLESGNADDIEADLDSVRSLGAGPLNRSLTELDQALSYSNPARQMGATHTLIEALDSRPDHQALLAYLAGSRLHDPILADRLYTRLIEVGGSRAAEHRVWLAMYRGDGDALWEMIGDPRVDRATRVYALELGTDFRVISDARIRAGATLLMDGDPYDWDVTAIYVEYLEEEGDDDTALQVVRSWLTRNAALGGFPAVYARTAMARLHQGRGELEEAWSWIEPVVASRQNGAVGRAALIQVRRGLVEEAVALADSAVRWYPRSSWSHAVRAEVLRKAGRADAAAQTMADAMPFASADRWREEFGAAFVAGHEARSVAEAVRSLEALSSTGIPTWMLIQLAAGVAGEGRADLAYELVARFAPTGSTEAGLWTMWGYEYLVASEGETRAIAWLRQRLPPEDYDLLAMFMFSERHGDLLWTAIPRPEDGREPTWVWLMRAASFVRDGADPDRQAALREYFGEDSSGDFARSIGRFLMGFDEQEDVLRLIGDRRSLSEVAYYVGLKAQAEGRTVDAVEWYRVVLDTGLEVMGEYRWALATLMNWVGSTRGVAGP